MTFTDIHTHTETPAKGTIYNCGCNYIANRSISVGIHPWNIGDGWRNDFAQITDIARANNVIAIGECGLDTLKSPAPLELQEEIFRAHIQLSESLKKPLIIHCVKAYDRLITIHKETLPGQPWVIHGFRGKPQLATRLTKAGLFISLGEKFNPQSAKAIPVERLFVESDEQQSPIANTYAAIAAAKGIPVEQLAEQIKTNVLIFGQF